VGFESWKGKRVDFRGVALVLNPAWQRLVGAKASSTTTHTLLERLFHENDSNASTAIAAIASRLCGLIETVVFRVIFLNDYSIILSLKRMSRLSSKPTAAVVAVPNS
jgi:hypothetical protein